MTDKKISYLVEQSYSGDTLNIKKVGVIKKILVRSDFKKYVKLLKKKEREKNVVVVSALRTIDKSIFQKMFPNKNIIYKIDTSLIVGAKIINNDMIYELNLKNTLVNISSYLDKIYE